MSLLVLLLYPTSANEQITEHFISKTIKELDMARLDLSDCLNYKSGMCKSHFFLQLRDYNHSYYFYGYVTQI